MRTLLSQFCEEFEAAVRPLLDPLKSASDTLSTASETVPARPILPALRDLRHQLQVVADKVGEQQAYVLIFGPLKSGKSTLMNAMAAAYVSEVTSLPAYPCMVYVSHSQTREFTVTRYDGEVDTFSDLTGLRVMLNRAHTELADRIRQVEGRGEEFDAQLHFPAAIRRIDVRVPAGELEQSGAVLVDTPGLYTRMKFGYDRMTREFRDTAACAIFVVKSENLFLEQVFEEFNELLALFSRIFLVVNLDSTKKDLKPDGSLAPSLECEDPVRIIQAFESLAMSARLKSAADEGRLRIYPVDLLRAASRRLRGGKPDPNDAEPLLALQGQADFHAFLGDLTDYLNSTDYLVAFLGDSIRHARSLLSDIKTHCGHPGVRELARRVVSLEADANRARHMGDVLGRLRGYDWNRSTSELRKEVTVGIRDAARQIRERTSTVLAGAIEGWFKSDASLNSLLSDDLAPVIEGYQIELTRTIHDAIHERVAGGAAGLRVPQVTAEDLQIANINLDSIGRAALIQVDSRANPDATPPKLDQDRIPVRKSLWDWILFRTQASVRRRMFGPTSKPTARIPAALKARRLGDAGKEAMRLGVVEHLDVAFPKTLDRLTERLFGEYAAKVQDALRTELNGKSTSNDGRRTQIEQQLSEIGRIRTEIEQLERRVDVARDAMDHVADRYGKTEPALLTQPVEELAEDEDGYVEIQPFAGAHDEDETHDEAAAEVAETDDVEPPDEIYAEDIERQKTEA